MQARDFQVRFDHSQLTSLVTIFSLFHVTRSGKSIQDMLFIFRAFLAPKMLRLTRDQTRVIFSIQVSLKFVLESDLGRRTYCIAQQSQMRIEHELKRLSQMFKKNRLKMSNKCPLLISFTPDIFTFFQDQQGQVCEGFGHETRATFRNQRKASRNEEKA